MPRPSRPAAPVPAWSAAGGRARLFCGDARAVLAGLPLDAGPVEVLEFGKG